MNKIHHNLLLSTCLIGLLLPTGLACAQGRDRVQRNGGLESGTVVSLNSLSVMLSKGGVENKIPVEDIRWIEFAGEPSELKAARSAFVARRYAEALEKLAAVPRDALPREEMKQELYYLTAASAAELALSGQGDAAAATRQAADFVKTERRSYLFTAALELLGDLYDAQGQHEQARAQYETLGRAPSAYFKSRSALLVGQSYQHEGKHELAVAEFTKATQEARGDSSAKEILLATTLANAVSEAALGKADLAVARLDELIIASTRDEQRLAQAYNALGDCYRQAGDSVAARLAYLHVDLLLPDAEQERAHALHKLAELWQASGNSARATQTRQRLATEYPHSRWAAE